MVVFSFLKNYRNVSSILILLTHCSYFLFPSITITDFCGLISEFSGVSSDRFSGENLKSTVYFLSQGHTDHMVALTSRSSPKRSDTITLKFFVIKFRLLN